MRPSKVLPPSPVLALIGPSRRRRSGPYPSLIIPLALMLLVTFLQPSWAQPIGHPDIALAETVWGSPASRMEIGPGDANAPFTVVLSNSGLLTITRIKGELALPRGFRNPSDPTSNVVVAHEAGPIRSGESFQLRFAISVDGDARLGEQLASLRLTWFRRGELKPLTATLEVPFTLTGRSSLVAELLNPIVRPGAVTELAISLRNEGTATAARVEAELTAPPSSQLSVLGRTLWSLGALAPGEGTVLKARVLAPLGLAETAQSLSLQLRYLDSYGNERSLSRRLGLAVASEGEEVIPLRLELSRLYLRPGEFEELSLTIINPSELMASDVVVKLVLPNLTPAPIALLEGEGIWRFDALAPSSSLRINFALMADLKVAGSLQPLTFEVSFRDPWGAFHIVTRTFSLQVRAQDAQRLLLTASLSQERVKAGTTNELLLLIKNEGELTAKSIEVTLTPSPQLRGLLSVVGRASWLVEALQPGKEVMLPIKLFASSQLSGGSGELELSLRFLDPFGNGHSLTRILGVEVGIPVINRILLEVGTKDPILSPGSTNLLELLVSNEGDSVAYNLEVIMNVPESLSSDVILVGNDGHWSLERLRPGETVVLEAGLLISARAAGRGLQLPITLIYHDASGASRVVQRSLGLTIATSSTSRALSVQAEPYLTVGTINELPVRLRNLRDGPLRELSLKLVPSDPRITILGSGEAFLEELQPEKEEVITFRAFLPEDMVNTASRLDLQVVYSDEEGRVRSEVFELGLSAIGLIRLRIIEASGAVVGGVPTINAVLLNEGNEDSLFTTIEVLPDGLPIGLRPKPVYLGDVSPNAPLPFSISLEGMALEREEKLSLQLLIKYQDALRRIHEVRLPLVATISPPVAATVEEGSPLTWLLLPPIAMALGLAAYALRRRKRHPAP